MNIFINKLVIHTRLDQSRILLSCQWNGKCGACIGIFQSVIAEQCDKDDLVECLMLLRNSDNPQAEYITQVITMWAEESGLIPSG